MGDKSQVIWDDDEDVVWDEDPPEQSKGILQRGWEAISTPLTTLPSRAARFLTEENPEQDLYEERLFDKMNQTLPGTGTAASMFRGFQKGTLQGAGDVLSQATSPVDLADMILFKGAGMAAKRGLTGTARALHNVGRVAGAPVAAHGATQVFGEDKTLPERAFGLAELAGGSAATLSKFSPPEMPVRKPRVRLVMEGVYENLDNGKFYDDTGVELIPAGKSKHFDLEATLAPEPELTLEPEPKPKLEEGQIEVKRPDMATTMAMNKEGYTAIRTDPDGTVIFGPKEQITKDVDWDDTPLISEMRVPGVREGIGGGENVALGGADPPVLDMLGTALYTGDRPKSVIKELLQNSLDERKLSGLGGKIKILMNNSTKDITGNEAKSMIITDEGRGLNAEQIYTIFSDVGKSGKRDDPAASGGFGFAKAAPFLASKYMKFESIVMENGKKIKYSFEGNPNMFKDQTKGVALDKTLAPPDAKTGTRIETFFDKDKYFYQAESEIKDIVTGSPGVKDVEFLRTYGSKVSERDFFDPNLRNPIGVEYLEGPTIGNPKDKIDTPTTDVDVYYDFDNKERTTTKVIYLNNGLYVKTDTIGHGMTPLPYIPEKLVLDIKSKVEEGVEGYPFGLNREELNKDLKANIDTWIQENFTKRARERYIDEIQKIYDDLQPISSTTGNNRHVILDSGGKYSRNELLRLSNSRIMRNVADIMEIELDEIAQLYPNARKSNKFGFRIAGPDKGGVNISSPKDKDITAILIDPFGAILNSKDPKSAARRIVHIILHEANHNRVRDEGAGFTWELANTYTEYPLERQLELSNELYRSITDPKSGDYAPEIQVLLHDYQESRGRPETVPDILSREADSQFAQRPSGEKEVSRSNKPDGEGTTNPKTQRDLNELIRSLADKDEAINLLPQKPKKGTLGQFWDLSKKEKALEIARASRSIQSSWDIAFGFRQGIGLMHTGSWWKNMWKNSIKSLLTEGNYEVVQRSIMNRPNAKSRIVDGKIVPSVYRRMGLALTDLGGAMNREEQMTSFLAEAVPGVRRSNRAYTAAANTIRADAADVLYEKTKEIYHTALRTGKARRGFFTEKFDTPEAIEALNPDSNPVLMKALGDYINAASGRGSLGKWENSASTLATLMFSPRLMASRLQMMNPRNYIKADPFIRKQYLKSMMMVASLWGTLATLGKLGGAEVSDDMGSADFGKIKIGNTRFDPAAGFQQYLVLFYRMRTGNYTTSTTGEEHRAGEGYGTRTRGDILLDFILNKTAPIPNAVSNFLFAHEYKPFDVSDRAVRLFMPILLQDISELLQDDPSLANLLGIPLAGVGMGVQSYDEREVGKSAIPGISGPEIY